MAQQLDNKFSAFWMDTTTAPGTPLTSLSATITIREADSPYTVVVNDEAMTNMGGGHYIYVFSGMSLEKEYVYICNPNATAYIESGVTQNNLYKWIQDNRSGGGGGFSVDLSPISRGIGNLSKLVTDESKLIKEHVTKENSETNSHLELVKNEALDKIEAIEIPETDISQITAGVGTLKGQFTKLSDWIKKKDDKEKSDELKEKEGEYSEVIKSIEEEYKTLLSSKESEIETLKKELEEEKKKEDGYEAMVQVLEEEISDKKEMAKKEIIKTLETL